ncbi:hypothetical protein L0222_13920 [bacterium]|nr:hypothetical protein [bacterium]MCI0602081.1 hypothetical protein [bacterium]
MSRHWGFKSITGPTGGYYTATYEHADAGTTAQIKIPAKGVYHGDPQRPLTKSAAEKIAKKLKATLNKNT